MSRTTVPILNGWPVPMRFSMGRLLVHRHRFGNGQKVSRPIVAMGIALVAIAILHLFKSGSLSSPNTYLGAFFVQSPSVFFGICQPASYSASLLTMIYVVRLVVFGSFMTLIVRQFSRR